MKVLIACEFSGIVREAFKAKGHDAWSCDFLETEIPGQHIIGNVLSVLSHKWDMMIAHPSCTYTANSGVRWLHEYPDRWKLLDKSLQFWKQLRDSGIPKIAMEQPIIHKYARKIMGSPTQIIQPWQFGHPETKATCLWLYGLPKLQPTNIVDGREGRVHKESPGPDRWKNRSRTYQGIAEAMAEQWGSNNYSIYKPLF